MNPHKHANPTATITSQSAVAPGDRLDTKVLNPHVSVKPVPAPICATSPSLTLVPVGVPKNVAVVLPPAGPPVVVGVSGLIVLTELVVLCSMVLL